MIKDKSIFIKNIYYMLSYAFTTLTPTQDDEIAAEEFDNIHNLFAAILAKGIGQQLKQGLYREYLNRKEDMPVMRGKIDMPGTIKNKLARKQVLTCEYDELSENNLLNQILKTTVMLLIRHAKVDAEYKSDLKKEMLFFSEVDTIEPISIKWSTIRFRRSNQSYRMLISLCQFILEGMLLTTDQGEYKMASFVDEQRMCRLYEKFILEYFSKHYPALDVRASQIPWALDDGIGTMLPVMQSDITLSYGNKVLIIDAKYYAHTMQVQYDKRTLHSNNLYQIFTYVKNKDSEFGDKPHEVSGMILYAQTDEAIQPDNTYMMSGNKISVKTLDLNCDFSEISAQLNAVVGNDAYLLRHALEPFQLTLSQFTQAGQRHRKPRTVLRLQDFLTGICPMIEIAPLRIDGRAEQRNICHLSDDPFQGLNLACGITIFLRKGVTAVHYKAKSLTVIGHVVVYQFDVVDFLISEFVIPLDGKFADLLHICHCGTPPISS
jgi:5-methylcytosine-specific restriction enzyme subunit McrC